MGLLAIASRVYNIEKGNFVIWDEAHFGKFASHYLKREFYFDVHPPLGKMLVALAGLIAGYDGSFEFESGTAYPEELRYYIMRIIQSLYGSMMVPIAYLTGIELGFGQLYAILGAVAVLCDNAYLSISRYILLDSMLLLFTVLTFYCMTVFNNVKKNESFTVTWWLWLCLTGVSIGLVSGVKWIGFFVTALVGLNTIEDLWNLLDDLKMPKLTYLRHFFARVIGLIIIPIAIYVASFKVHFLILSNSGPGDAQMSSLFQSQLEGNDFVQNSLFIAYGSNITLKNVGYGGGLLHSHVQTYPHGSKQQQVTAYHHKDDNNIWIVKRTREAQEAMKDVDEIEFVKNGDIIRLLHAPTSRNLHSHPMAAPITKTGFEVSGYGNDEIGDNNDYWRVEIVDDVSGSSENTTLIRSLFTRFRLVHVSQKCLLRSHNVILPEWGFKQHEVLCDRFNMSSRENMWNVEQHWNSKLPPGDSSQYKTRFWKDFIDLNVGMYTSNNALTPDPDKEPDLLTSEPSEWPLLYKGLRMCGWDDEKYKVYLIGNPVVWWGGTASLMAYSLLWFFYILRKKRGFHDFSPENWGHFIYVGKILILGWALHFLPFYIMSRVTYLHHYFPALYFSILLLSYLARHVTSWMPNSLQYVSAGLIYLLVVGTHIYFAPISYGFVGPASQYESRKWRTSWHITD